jgi:hypothetical protein
MLAGKNLYETTFSASGVLLMGMKVKASSKNYCHLTKRKFLFLAIPKTQTCPNL